MDVNGDPWYIEFIKQRATAKEVSMTNLFEILGVRAWRAEEALRMLDLGLAATDRAYQATCAAWAQSVAARQAWDEVNAQALRSAGTEDWPQAWEASQAAFAKMQKAFAVWEAHNARLMDLYKVRQIAREAGWGYW